MTKMVKIKATRAAGTAKKQKPEPKRRPIREPQAKERAAAAGAEIWFFD
jgi:hypothetical protein